MLHINIDRLSKRLNALGECGSLAGGGVARLALSAEDKLGRDLVYSWMQDLGLDIRIDQIGNVIGILPGKSDLAPVMMGSHIDTVRTGGLYDGNLGVLAGLEVIESIKEQNIDIDHPVAVGFFTNEEGARFAPDMMGSLAYVGDLDLEEALNTKDANGLSVRDCLNSIGYAGEYPVKHTIPKCFIELHIEQGPVLDIENIDIGVVTGVQGISWHQYEVVGISNHAGTTPMSMRKDAGYLAATTHCFIRELAHKMGGNQVATMGVMEVSPNLINVIPNKAKFTIDLRNTDDNLLIEAENAVEKYLSTVADENGLTYRKECLARFEPVTFDTSIADQIAHLAEKSNLTYKYMPSGAGHDAQMFARICPSAMIFIPSKDGISHNITEYSSPAQIKAGADILLNLVVSQAKS